MPVGKSIWNQPIKFNWRKIKGKIKTFFYPLQSLSPVEIEKPKTAILTPENHSGDKAMEQFPLDLYQTPQTLVIKTPLAVKPKDVTVEVEKNSLTIRVKRPNEDKVDKIGYHRHECLWGELSRTINLPLKNFELNTIEASVHNGLLTVILPKIREYQGKLILLGSLHVRKKTPSTNTTDMTEKKIEPEKKSQSIFVRPVPLYITIIILLPLVSLFSVGVYYFTKDIVSFPIYTTYTIVPARTSSPIPSTSESVDEDVVNLVISSQNIIPTDSGRNIFIVGEIKNEKQEEVKEIKITFDFFDKNGTLLRSYAKNNIPSVVAALSQVPYKIKIDDPPTDYQTVNITAKGHVNKSFLAKALSIVNQESKIEKDGNLVIYGKIKNDSQENVNFVAVYAYLIDETGKVVSVRNSYYDLENLKPATESEYEIKFINPPTYKSFKVVAEGR